MFGIRTSSGSRYGLVAAAAGILAISAAALFLAPPESAYRDGITPAAASAEYTAEVEHLKHADFSLPPGVAWPTDAGLETTGPDGAPMTYEKGFGAVRADRFWFLAWAESAVMATDETARQQAVRQLARVRGLALYKTKLPEDKAYVDTMIDRAGRGDLTTLTEYVSANE